MTENTENIGSRIKAIRKHLGLNNRTFAEKAGTTSGYLSHIEAGIKKPGSEILCSLLVNLNVNINYVLSGRGEMFITESAPDADFKQNVKAEVKEMLLEYGLIDVEK